MTSTRAFRFSAAMPRLAPTLPDTLQRIESYGFDSVSISDHFTDGWEMDPIVAMTAAAVVTTSLRVLSLVLAVDYRHPVQAHKALATLDVISGGRVEVGLGVGFKRSEYDAAGFEFLPFAERIEKFAEAVDIISRLFGDEPVEHDGRYYQLHVDGLPKPVQRPRPPILLGGYGERVLRLAATTADIVGIFPRLDPVDFAEKVKVVQTAADAAGREPELQLSVLEVHLTDVTESGWRSGSLTPEGARQLQNTPAVLVGTLDECERQILDARERYGISYFNIGGPPENAAPLIERMAGR